MPDDTYPFDDDFERSSTCRTPWKVSTKTFPTRYGRRSSAIVDAEGKVIILLDPSSGEYAEACPVEIAKAIVAMVNK